VTQLEGEEAQRASTQAAEEARLAELLGEQERANAHAAELRTANAQAQKDIAASEALLAGFERRHNEMTARIEKLEREREELVTGEMELTARTEQLGRDVEDLRAGKVTSADEMQRIEQTLATLRHDIVGSERALDEAKSDLAKKRSRLHALEEM